MVNAWIRGSQIDTCFIVCWALTRHDDAWYISQLLLYWWYTFIAFQMIVSLVHVILVTQLGECFLLIRFGEMTLEELSQRISSGLLKIGELGDARQCICFKGYKSKVFNQKSRFCWNEENIWRWRLKDNNNAGSKLLQRIEGVRFTSNKTTLLGGKFSCRVSSYGYHLNINTPVYLIENSSASEKILFFWNFAIYMFSCPSQSWSIDEDVKNLQIKFKAYTVRGCLPHFWFQFVESMNHLKWNTSHKTEQIKIK